MKTGEKFKTIDRAGLKAKIDKNEKMHLWNVLDGAHYKPESVIAGSKWIPFDTLTEIKVGEIVSEKTETIVVYGGGDENDSTKSASGKLASYGYTGVFAYEGGLKDWS